MKDLFITEADLALLVEHPNLIHAYEAGEIDGRYYIAMELIEGGTLRQFTMTAARRNIPVPIDIGLFIISEVLEGLHALHETRGGSGRLLELVHRDVSPQNIFLSYDGRVVLGDLGIAIVRAYGEAHPLEIFGKLGYLAPEMLALDEVDRRADLFAIGVITYQLLTGVRPFTGKTPDEVLSQITGARFAPARTLNPSIQPALDGVLARTLARHPAGRFDTAEALLYAFEPFWSKKRANPFLIASLVAKVYERPAPRIERPVGDSGQPLGK